MDETAPRAARRRRLRCVAQATHEPADLGEGFGVAHGGVPSSAGQEWQNLLARFELRQIALGVCARGSRGTGRLDGVAATEAGLAVAAQKLAVMRELTARHSVVHLDMPDPRDVVARIGSDRGNGDAKQRP
ncbi:hypothetical protein [Streptomyces sp. SLBN-115]|uniref:hypothetical protein n=1 Tax=Streptomyces sp. SLBN-115 TaxID=2768453 RepID=UPI0011526121|nr:hypothetical protein [Streptomyces sp. SLBN-115]